MYTQLNIMVSHTTSNLQTAMFRIFHQQEHWTISRETNTWTGHFADW